MRLSRLDFLGSVRVRDGRHFVSPEAIEAHRNAQGYLVMPVRLARDGTLEYSDGETTWLERRTRDELVRAAESFRAVAVTDEHPPVMLDSSNTRDHARGWTMQDVQVVEDGGVAYLEGTVVVMDEALIARIAAGKTEVSIGFTARVVPVTDVSRDGAKYEQVDLLGNHLSFVEEGRAGPEARALLDGSTVTVQQAERPPRSDSMKTRTKPPKGANPVDAKTDGESTVLNHGGQAYTIPTELYTRIKSQAIEEAKDAEEEEPDEDAKDKAKGDAKGNAALLARIDALEAKLAKSEKDGGASAKAYADARIALLTDAAAVLGEDALIDLRDADSDDIRGAVIVAVMGDSIVPKLEARGDDASYVEALYDMAIADFRANRPTTTRLLDSRRVNDTDDGAGKLIDFADSWTKPKAASANGGE